MEPAHWVPPIHYPHEEHNFDMGKSERNSHLHHSGLSQTEYDDVTRYNFRQSTASSKRSAESALPCRADAKRHRAISLCNSQLLQCDSPMSTAATVRENSRQAQQQVLAVPELVVLILFQSLDDMEQQQQQRWHQQLHSNQQAPPVDASLRAFQQSVTTLRLVCKYWNSIINDFPMLRNKVRDGSFFSSPSCHFQSNGLRINTDVFNRGLDHHHDGCRLKYGLVLRPHLFKLLSYAIVFKHYKISAAKILARVTDQHFLDNVLPHVGKLTDPQSQMYQTQLCQPAVKRLVFRWGDAVPFGEKIDVAHEQGVTLGRLFAAMMESTRQEGLVKPWDHWVIKRRKHLRQAIYPNPYESTPSHLLMVESFVTDGE